MEHSRSLQSDYDIQRYQAHLVPKSGPERSQLPCPGNMRLTDAAKNVPASTFDKWPVPLLVGLHAQSSQLWSSAWGQTACLHVLKPVWMHSILGGKLPEWLPSVGPRMTPKSEGPCSDILPHRKPGKVATWGLNDDILGFGFLWLKLSLIDICLWS